MRFENLIIEKAQKEDCPTLSRISKAAKAYWDYPPEWLAMWETDLTITEEDLEQFQVFKLVEDQKILGYCVISENGPILEIEHLWVLPEQIGRGLGKYLLENVLKRVVQKSHTTLTVIADPNAVGFYEKFGLKWVRYIPSQPEGRQLPVMLLNL